MPNTLIPCLLQLPEGCRQFGTTRVRWQGSPSFLWLTSTQWPAFGGFILWRRQDFLIFFGPVYLPSNFNYSSLFWWPMQILGKLQRSGAYIVYVPWYLNTLYSEVLWLHETFWFKVVWPNKPIWAPDKHLKIFRFWFQICQDTVFYFSCFPYILHIYVQICSPYSQYTKNFIPRILSVWIDSFSMHSKIPFEYLPNSAYSPNMYRFTLRILSIQTDSFRIFSLYAQIHIAHSANVPEHFWICGMTLFSSLLL